MTQGSLVQAIMRRALVPVLLVVLTPELHTAAFAFTQRDSVNPQAAAMYEFQQRLNAYLKLREEFGRRLEPLSPTTSAAQLSARQEALAAALRTARKTAKQGDLIPAATAEQIARICLEDFHFRNPKIKLAALKEAPNAPRPAINGTYPENEALATVPPLLLSKLPQLPDNLQYRFFGRHLVILDGDTQIIIDYVPNALPPH